MQSKKGILTALHTKQKKTTIEAISIPSFVFIRKKGY